MSNSATAQTRVAQAALLVGFFLAADKVLGLFRNIVITRTFGTSGELDAYYAAFELPDGLFTLIAGSALTTALIPILTARIQSETKEDVWRLVSAVVNWVLGIVAVCSVLAAIFAPQIIAGVAPGFGPDRAELAVQLMRLVLLQTLISCLSGVAMSTLQAHQHFLLPAAAPLAYTLGRIAGALFLAPHWGIFGLAWGGLLGTVGHFCIQVPGLIKYRVQWWPTFSHPALPQVVKLMGPRMLGLGVTYLSFVLPTYLGSSLQAGMISAYENAWQLMQFPETIIGTALGLTIFPTLAERANAQDWAGLRRTGGWALRLVLTLAIPAGAALMVLGEPLTAFFFQRGAFDAAATERVAFALRILGLGLVGHASLEVVSRLFYARRDMWTPLGAACAGLTVNVAIGVLLLPVLAQGAIALANSVGACLQVVILLVVARSALGGIEGRALASSLGRTLVATLLMVATIGGIQWALPGLDGWRGLLVSAGAGGVVYLLAAVGFKQEELMALPKLVTSRGRE